MTGPRPLPLATAAVLIAAIGLLLWRQEGIMVALSGIVAYCL